jgi:uroporphyrinogen decarboxylase
MTSWTKHDRFNATLSGQVADRPPVSAWRHFVDAENDATSLAEVTASFTRAWDWDWVKLNPRATYYAEAWGSTFDAHDYHDVLPRQLRAAVERPSDLPAIGVLSAAANEALSEQLTAARLVRAALPDVPVTETVFSPLSVLLQLAGLPLYAGGVIYGSTPTVTIAELLTADRSAVHHALHAIALTLADYVTALVSPGVGLDGIFYAVTGTASPGLIDEATFRELSRPYDEIVLSAASGAHRILHTCGPTSNPEWFDDYPADAVHWDQHAAGNPDVDLALRAVPVGGVAHTLFGAHDDATVGAQARAALARTRGRAFLLAPACSVPITADDASLAALRDAVEA